MMKKDLYNKIMSSISKEIKKTLNKALEKSNKFERISYLFDLNELLPDNVLSFMSKCPLKNIASGSGFGGPCVINNGQIKLNESFDIHDLNYVFDDLHQIPEVDRKRQYMMPLSSIAAGFPYGHQISFINEKHPYIIESATKTYDAKYTIKEMKALFGFEDWQIKEYINPGIYVTLMLLFGNIYDNKDAVIKSMKSYGWSFSYESAESIIGNEHWIMLHFDPIFQEHVNGEILQKEQKF